MIVSEDTRQALDEVRARMEDIRLSLIGLGETLESSPESEYEAIRQQLMELQREGLRLAGIYRWLLLGAMEKL
jgi:hypothetical protein